MKDVAKISDKRTQIYLPAQLHKQVKKHAQQRGVSMATVIRTALEWQLREVSPEYHAEQNDLLDVAGIVKEEVTDVSEHISAYVQEMYRKKK